MESSELLREARERFERAYTAEQENRSEQIDDLKFKAGDQWPEDIRKQRETEDRPVLTINRMGQFVRQVMGDIRQNSPSIKTRPVDDNADVDTAEIYEGLIRQIEHSSSAPMVYSTAADFQVTCGYGAFRVNVEFCNERSFDRDIKLLRIRNPFTVYFDPDAVELTKKDGKFAFVTETLSKKEFESRFPNATAIDFENALEGESYERWYGEDNIRIAEYWVKEEEEIEIAQLANGEVIEAEKATHFDDVVQKRKAKQETVKQYLISGSDILEEAKEWKIKYIPIIPVYGEEINIEGKTTYQGVVRPAKDPQRLYNYWRTTGAELIALQPKAPYMLTTEQVKGHEKRFKKANKVNLPYLLFNADKLNPGSPKREQPPQPPAAIWQEASIASDDMKAAVGIYDSSLGNQSNETSGRAILARQRESDSANYIYIDHLSHAIEHAGRIIVDLIPLVYDTERVIRILGEDDSEKMVAINKVVQGPQGPEYENDLTQGKYDVRVSVGPSYATKRMEAADTMMQFIQSVPGAAQLAGDLIARNMDWPGSDEIADRLAKTLPPGIKEIDPESPEAQQQAAAQQEADQKQAMMEQLQKAMMQAELKGKEAKANKDEAAATKDIMETLTAEGQIDGLVEQKVLLILQQLLQPDIPNQLPQQPAPAGFFTPEENATSGAPLGY